MRNKIKKAKQVSGSALNVIEREGECLYFLNVIIFKKRHLILTTLPFTPFKLCIFF